MRPRWLILCGTMVILMLLGVISAEGQLIDEDFDSYTTGAVPPVPWIKWGTSGTVLVSDSVFAGSSGKSMEIIRDVFDGAPFGIVRHFTPLHGQAELTFHFYSGSAEYEILDVFGRNTDNDQIGWWIVVGGTMEDRIGTYSDSQGWIEVMGIAPDTWYGVHLLIDMDTAIYDITAWEDGNPSNTNTVLDVDFRNGTDAGTINELQFANFNADPLVVFDYAYVDDLHLIGPTVFIDDFESGNTDAWSGEGGLMKGK